ncbi:hypothetical protein Tco_0710895 [Tanacetum coccineum]
MSLEASDDLVIPDTEAIDPILEANSLPKFDMHLHKSSLTETHVKWLTKCYEIPGDLRPRVVSEGMTMDALPNDAIGLYLVPLVDRRAAPIAMAWRHHDSSVADPFPKPDEYNASDVAKLREVVIALRKPPPTFYMLQVFHKHAGHVFLLKDPKGKVVTMAEYLRLPNFQRCKVAAGALLPPDSARVTHLSTPAAALEDVTPLFLQYSSGS